jgi:hypothetical protein
MTWYFFFHMYFLNYAINKGTMLSFCPSMGLIVISSMGYIKMAKILRTPKIPKLWVLQSCELVIPPHAF